MEQLDPEDGLAVWDFTEGSESPVETSPSSACLRLYDVDAGRILIDGVNVRYSDQRSVRSRTATTNRTVLVVTPDRDLGAIADRVVTPARPGSRGLARGPPKDRTRTKRKEVNTMPRIIKPVMNQWDRDRHPNRRMRSGRRDRDDRGRRHDRSRDRSW